MNGSGEEYGCVFGNNGRKSKPNMTILSNVALRVPKLGSTQTQGKATGELPIVLFSKELLPLPPLKSNR